MSRTGSVIGNLNRLPEVFRCARHTSDWLPLTIRYAGLKRDGFPFTASFKVASAVEFQNLADLATWWQIFYRHVYPVTEKDKVIIDAGANIGAFTLYALEHAPSARIVAIEPFPDTFRRLRAALPSSCLARVRALNAALCSHSGGARMDARNIGSQFRSLLDERSTGEIWPSAAVASCTLAEIIEQEGDVDLLKLDIEGSEYEAVQACPIPLLRRIRRVAMEFHPFGPASGENPLRALLERLAEAGLNATAIQHQPGGYGMAYLRRPI